MFWRRIVLFHNKIPDYLLSGTFLYKKIEPIKGSGCLVYKELKILNCGVLVVGLGNCFF